MTVLGIDTSAVTCTVALYSDRLLSEYSLTDGPTHSQTLLPAVKSVLEEASRKVSDLDAIAVSVGPGSFTGLRIGISTAKGLSFSNHIPCVPVSTLQSLAVNAINFEGALVCAVMDARRGEFYNALFRIQNAWPVRLTQDRALPGDVIARELEGEEKVVILGDGALKFTEQNPFLSSFLAPANIRFQSGKSVAMLGICELENNHSISCHKLSPNYLRLPQAEREWLEKNKNKINK